VAGRPSPHDGARLKRRIEARFGVVMHERTAGNQLAALGFRRLSVGPQHPKSDPEAQEVFKKTSRRREQTPCRSAPGASPWRSGFRMKRAWASRER